MKLIFLLFINPLLVLAQDPVLKPEIETLLVREAADYERARVALLTQVGEFEKTEKTLAGDNSQEAKKKILAAFKATKFSRSSWEKFFSVKWSSKDTAELEKWQDQVAELRRQQAHDGSVQMGFDFTQLRGDEARASTFCKALPKGGMLHVHPYGTLDRAAVEYILDFFNPSVSRDMKKYGSAQSDKIHPTELVFLDDKFYDQPRAYRDLLKTRPADARRVQDWFFMPRDESIYSASFTPFERFLGSFVAPLDLLGITNGNVDVQVALETILYDRFFQRSLQNKIEYVELTRSLPTMKDIRDFPTRYKELVRWTDEMDNKATPAGTVRPRMLLSFSRTGMATDERQVSQLGQVNQLLATAPGKALVGINLVGNEEGFPALDTAQFIYGKMLAHSPSPDFENFHLKPAIHAGELGDVRNLRDSLVFGVRRIGHGVKFMENPVYLEMARRQKTAVESNLVSNELLQVADIEKNPYVRFLRLGLPVSLSTDDEGMFRTDLNHDCAVAISRTDIEYVELKQMILNSIETSFADKTLKQTLREKLAKDLQEFEKDWLKSKK